MTKLREKIEHLFRRFSIVSAFDRVGVRPLTGGVILCGSWPRAVFSDLRCLC